MSDDLSLFMRRGHRRPRLRQASRRARPGAAYAVHRDRGGRHRRRQPRASSSGRPSSTGADPADEIFTTEYFGPILAVHPYPDADYSATLEQAADATPYALTGSILATDRTAIAQAAEALRYSAGNFYINDKPTGAVVGQQPFGGARASGTDDKAGSVFNLIRWVSARAVKELFVPPSDYRYPHMG